MQKEMTEKTGPLSGIRILDLSRILAGPTCTQLLGDLGAEVIKIERPGRGDDTRTWGPPYVTDIHQEKTTESAYYLSVNRNKRSVAIDLAHPQGQALIKQLLTHCDVLIENFKTDDLLSYGLDYDHLGKMFPGLVYCSITGFGHTGPYSHRLGYDFLIQGMGGIMSITGDPDGSPMKVGVGIADVMCGMYATVAILAALRHCQITGKGQHIDLALFDTQVAWLINVGMNYLISGENPQQLGNAHPNIAPYQVYPSSDDRFILAIGNDLQFQRFCTFVGHPEIASDSRFVTNAQRVCNRPALTTLIEQITMLHPVRYWIEKLEELGIPCGPINTIAQVFADPQVHHREMKVTLPYPLSAHGMIDLIGNPIKFSETPVCYCYAPPTLGEHTDTVLRSLLGLKETEIAYLHDHGIVA